MRKNLFVVIFCYLSITSYSQSRKDILDTVYLNDICVEDLCFGDSISKMIDLFGQPDTIIFNPTGDWEFAEPSHNIYYYKGIHFYEILNTGLSKGLVYGCRIRRSKVSIKISEMNLVTGETRITEMQKYFPKTDALAEKVSENKYRFSIYPIIPSNLSRLETAFIQAIDLTFINGILIGIYTPLDKN